ncbi:MAG TPA: Holliday junction branch migration protein RuvA [Oligoflexus sp.]|uniref:Holliday junction branch migration protein RuvA n=1 Tax=Oligoflexus sp. TaxID=1971216 RepID=UPI002D5481A2|nr:Holliday junction branch migration protein RuvA [Oligoflexus sp.]HYX39193.1 Holliday junction branch migration protein RuvA [Oligoflexus sp.]
MYIERLTGTFFASLPTGIILDVQGVGYGLELPLSTLCQLPKVGQKISLWIYTYVREDAIRFFGFRSYEDRQAFEILLSLSGVGPKVALAILSTLTVNAIDRAVTQDDGKILESVPGVGPRLAEKIIVDLRPKLLKLKAAQLLDMRERSGRLDSDDLDGPLPLDHSQSSREHEDMVFSDLESALENLGYKDKTITPLLTKLRKESAHLAFPDLMRQALKQLSQGTLGPEKKREVKERDVKGAKGRDLGLADNEPF